MALPETSSWTIHLAAQRPGRVILALFIIMLTLFAVSSFGQSALLTIIDAILLLGSIAEFLLPVTYTFDVQGAHMRHLLHHRILPWQRVRRVYVRKNGIQLSPLTVRSWVESYRGILLRTPNREAVLIQMHAWLDAAGVTPEILEES